MSIRMRFVNRLCSLLLGFVLFAAGFLKLMDPVGAGLVVQDYFKLAGLYFLFPASKALAVILALLETLLGTAVITGVWRRIIAWISAVLLAFFTLVTGLLLIFNPEMDCGCFGEALHLTHLQTFIKNLALCVLWTGAFLPFNRHHDAPPLRYVAQAIVTLAMLLFTFWSHLSVPPVDFTPYKPGTMLQDDSSGLSFSDADGEYCDSLLFSGKTLLVSAYDADRMPAKRWEAVSALAADAAEYGIPVIVLVPDLSDDLSGRLTDPVILSNIYFADRKDLMTFNRSNGGLTFVEDGMIVRKWSSRAYPDSSLPSYLQDNDSSAVMVETASSSRLKLQAFLLFTFAVMLLL